MGKEIGDMFQADDKVIFILKRIMRCQGFLYSKWIGYDDL